MLGGAHLCGGLRVEADQEVVVVLCDLTHLQDPQRSERLDGHAEVVQHLGGRRLECGPSVHRRRWGERCFGRVRRENVPKIACALLSVARQALVRLAHAPSAGDLLAPEWLRAATARVLGPASRFSLERGGGEGAEIPVGRCSGPIHPVKGWARGAVAPLSVGRAAPRPRRLVGGRRATEKKKDANKRGGTTKASRDTVHGRN